MTPIPFIDLKSQYAVIKDKVEAGIKRVLGLIPEDEIHLPKGGGVEVSGPTVGKRVRLEGWADGYRLTLAWLLDLYGWAMRADRVQPNGGIEGILLIDEIEQHLHPSMQTRILPRLGKILPDLQIIATTHSPLIALSVGTVLIGHESARREQQRRLAVTNFILARDSVDRMLSRVGEVELADVPQMEPVRRELLTDALRFYEEFVRRGDGDPALRLELGRALIRLARVQDLLGDSLGAERSYRRAIITLAGPAGAST